MLDRINLGLSDKISLTVIAVGVLGLMLVYYTSIYYRDIAYEHYQRSLQILARIKIEEIIIELKSNSADLARAIEEEPGFEHYATENQHEELADLLDNQFYQYFVTANILDLAKLYILDADFKLISASNEGTDAAPPEQLICSEFSNNAKLRSGAERLQLIAGTCEYEARPFFVLISPYGGLKVDGYIQILVDLTSSLKKLETALGMPVQIRLRDNTIAYQSGDWAEMNSSSNHLPVEYTLGTFNNEDSARILLLADMTEFNQRVLSHRNWVMALATISVAATVILILYFLQSSTITPLSRIHRITGRLQHDTGNLEKESRVLFSQLLDNIITLQKNRKRRFTVMILDLDKFEAVNRKLGHDAGTELLKHVGERLTGITRESDIISWTGTDTPGHKLLPADSKTEYRATLARLGGDEFGMLLPSAENESQAIAVARRIIDSLASEYTINDQQINLRCCIGISIYPDHGQHAQELIRNADKAMFKAKQSAGNYCIYSSKTL